MIISFYSYEPHAGCTKAALNIGYIFCQEFKKRCLIVNWNFNPLVFSPHWDRMCPSPKISLYKLLHEYKEIIDGDAEITKDRLNQFGTHMNPTLVENLYCLPPFVQTDVVAGRSPSLDWEDFYEIYKGGLFVEYLKSLWRNKYEIVLILSDRGHSPAAPICTVQLPDTVIAMIERNRYSLKSMEHMFQRITDLSKELNVKKPNLLPVLSKAQNTEIEVQEAITKEARQTLSGFLPDALQTNNDEYFTQAQSPEISNYVFADNLAVVNDPNGKQANFYRWIAKQLIKLTNSDVSAAGQAGLVDKALRN